MNISDYTKGTVSEKPLIVQCCVCRQIRHRSGAWETIPIPSNVEISHTYCEPCGEKVLQELKGK